MISRLETERLGHRPMNHGDLEDLTPVLSDAISVRSSWSVTRTLGLDPSCSKVRAGMAHIIRLVKASRE
jgi:hypothetical protein